MEENDAQLQLKKRARRRLVGAVAFAVFAAVVLPMVMDQEPKQPVQDVEIRIPGQDEKPFTPKFAAGTPAAEAAKPAPLEPAAAPVTAEPAPKPAEPPVPAKPATPAAETKPAVTPSTKVVDTTKADDKPATKTSEKPATKPAEKAPEKAKEKTPEKPQDKSTVKAGDKASDKEKAEKEKAEKAKAAEKAAEKADKADKADKGKSDGEAQRAAAILSGKAPEAAKPDSGNGSFVILIGSFSNDANVKTLKTKLSEQGIKVYTESLDSPQGKKTRVRAGPFPSRDAAEKALDKMKRIGVSGVLAGK